jgi:hypothetical protein
MTFRTDFQVAYDAVQSIAGPAGLDVRSNRVYRVVRSWSGGMVGLGTATDQKTELTPRPRVVEREMGRKLIVEPVSQAIAIATVHPKDSATTEVLYEVVGPNAGLYVAEDYAAARPFRQRLVLLRLERRQPQPEG